MDPAPIEFQFPCEARRSCVVRTEESLIGPTTMTQPDLSGSVWLRCSQRGWSTNKVLTNSVRSFAVVFVRPDTHGATEGARGVHQGDHHQHGERAVDGISSTKPIRSERKTTHGNLDNSSA